MNSKHMERHGIGCDLGLLIEIAVKDGVQIDERTASRWIPIQTLSARGFVEKRSNNLYVLSEKGKQYYSKIIDYAQSLLE